VGEITDDKKNPDQPDPIARFIASLARPAAIGIDREGRFVDG
jgi:hypothetical protein